MSWMGRLAAGGVVWLLAAAGARVWAGAASETAAAPPGPAQVAYFEGEVWVGQVAAVLGQEVPPGSTVRTGAAAYCEILFAGRNIFRLQESTVAVIDVDGATGSISLREGALAAVFYKLQRLGSGEAAVSLRTPVAVAGVRGTAFFVKVESPTSTYVCTCNGTLRLADVMEGNRREVQSDTHKALRFAEVSGAIQVSAAGLLYHSDATMDALARKIHVRIPWARGRSGTDGGY